MQSVLGKSESTSEQVSTGVADQAGSIQDVGSDLDSLLARSMSSAVGGGTDSSDNNARIAAAAEKANDRTRENHHRQMALENVLTLTRNLAASAAPVVGSTGKETGVPESVTAPLQLMECGVAGPLAELLEFAAKRAEILAADTVDTESCADDGTADAETVFILVTDATAVLAVSVVR